MITKVYADSLDSAWTLYLDRDIRRQRQIYIRKLVLVVVDPFLDLDCSLSLDHCDVHGPLLECVDELRHDTIYEKAGDASPQTSNVNVDAFLPDSNKLQDEGGGI